jgi:gamma-glutamyltranspeptidase/glutathione hydrolase
MAVQSQWIPQKTSVTAERGMVVAKHPLAAAAGMEILEEGGNAVDAAVAMGFALTVVKPMMTCLAGVGYLLAHDAARGEQWCFDGAPRAPLAAHPEIYDVLNESTGGIGLYQVRGDENAVGHRAAAVPGLVAILCNAHQRLGKLPLTRVLEPAIRLAADGWPVDWTTALHAANEMPQLMRNAAAAAIFLPGGFPPHSRSPATVLKQTDLAESLREIARKGTAGFYAGDVAHAIEDDMREHGGWITAEDLAHYPHRADPPLRVPYRGHTLLIPPMPCGGTTAAETLRILDHFDVGAAGHNTPESLHLFAEAARRAFADRFHYLGDPERVDVPVSGLLSDGHATALAAMVDRDRSLMTAAPGESEPWARFAAVRPAGDPWAFDGGARPAASLAGAHPARGEDTCTTHLAAVDTDRNGVCLTITAAGVFGARVVTKGTGILWNNGMTWFNPLPGTANSIAPGKRALTNMTPVIVMRGDAPYVLIGAPGGRKIICAIAQIVSNVLDHNLPMQEAVGAPRIDVSANQTLADERLDRGVVEELERRGHHVSVVQDSPGLANFSRPLGIMIDPDTRQLHSGLTPFHLAEARGF